MWDQRAEFNTDVEKCIDAETRVVAGYGDGITGPESVVQPFEIDDIYGLAKVAYPVTFAGSNTVAFWVTFAFDPEVMSVSEAEAKVKHRAEKLAESYNFV